MFASDVIKKALSKLLNRDDNNEKLNAAQEEKYYPAKFDESVPMERQHEQEINSNALRIPLKINQKSAGLDPGYDQGRSIVNTNFYEDSGNIYK